MFFMFKAGTTDPGIFERCYVKLNKLIIQDYLNKNVDDKKQTYDAIVKGVIGKINFCYSL